MPYPSIANTDLDTDSPVDEALINDGLRLRDVWNWSAATGSGVNPNAVDLHGAMSSHSHDGSAGAGDQIPTAGIATNAVNNSNMLAAGAVETAKIAATTVDTVDLADGAVTLDKLTGSLGQQVSGSHAFDYGVAAGVGLGNTYNIAFQGDCIRVANPKGALGVICNIATGDFFVHQQDASYIYLGIRTNVYGSGAGTWYYDFWIM